MKVLAIIPARSGSKGLPGKNTRLIKGHPLLVYSVRSAQICPQINRTIVSTDCEHIASIARAYCAEVPFLRPPELALDSSTDLEVFQNLLEKLVQSEGYSPDYIVHLRPTSPIRFLHWIEDCIGLLSASDADSVRTISEVETTPYKMWKRVSESPYLIPLLSDRISPEPYNMPRQSLPKIYQQTGTLDVIRTTVITGKNSMSGQRILPYLIPRELSVDIDDLAAFERAEHLIHTLDCIQFESAPE